MQQQPPRLEDVAVSLGSLDAATAPRARTALALLATTVTEPGDPAVLPDLPRLRRFLTRELASALDVPDRELHELAWALGDLLEGADYAEHAALCRAPVVHQALTRWRWTRSFEGVPEPFWHAALAAVERGPEVPRRVVLSVSSAHALLLAVGNGLPLTPDRQLPLTVVAALDDRFRWTEEFPWMRVTAERDVAPLRLLHEHLLAQGLLRHEADGGGAGGRLLRTEQGRRCTGDGPALWGAIVDPAPRWSRDFERDVLAVLAASLLRSADFALGRVGEEVAHVLSAKWRPAPGAGAGPVYDGAVPIAQTWYQLGVPLGWWDTGRGAADRRPNVFGRAAAAAVFRSVASR